MESKWRQHVRATQLIKQHPDWTDEQILEAADMKPLEINIVQEARREVETETVPGVVRSERSY